jgi:hypothetical protein
LVRAELAVRKKERKKERKKKTSVPFRGCIGILNTRALRVARYGGSKLERSRELFEQALASKVPPPHAAELYLKYAKLEEDHGLVRHAMAVYDRATKVTVS